ncbi:CLK4-associating serine/arginine rich protein [Glycine soja]|nr:CLK4-associating serine/arginine rich protein [Glycine soja]
MLCQNFVQIDQTHHPPPLPDVVDIVVAAKPTTTVDIEEKHEADSVEQEVGSSTVWKIEESKLGFKISLRRKKKKDVARGEKVGEEGPRHDGRGSEESATTRRLPRQETRRSSAIYSARRLSALYQASQDQQGLIPWNGKQDVLIDRFDGRALLDFVRDSSHRRAPEKSEEEEELEEFVNFERYRDLIKHRRRGFTDEEALEHVNQEMEAKAAAPFTSDRSNLLQPAASKGSYSQVRYGWLVYMDKKAKEEEKRQKELIKGDPAIRKLSRKERRKASQIEREREREATRISGTRVLHHDPYRETRQSPTYEAYSRSRRSRSRSRSYSPSHSRRYSCSGHSDDIHRSKPRTPKIEYITEFGGSGAAADEPRPEGFSPSRSPTSQVDLLNRPTSSCILEALHVDPASGVSIDKDKGTKVLKPSVSGSSALAKLKTGGSGGPLKQQGEKKETPQERLKRIMNKQLNKQIKKDTAAELAKKREQERQRQEKLAETSRLSRYRCRSRSRSFSGSPPRPCVLEGFVICVVYIICKEDTDAVEVQVVEVPEDIILVLVPLLAPVPAHVLGLLILDLPEDDISG